MLQLHQNIDIIAKISNYNNITQIVLTSCDNHWSRH